MPIHLPAFSRREFLKRALLAGAACAIAPNALAASRRADPDLVALLADTHIATDLARIERKVNMAEHFRAVSRELLALKKNPATTFIVGDLALNEGLPGDYDSLVGLLDPLRAGGIDFHLALGNHDERDNFGRNAGLKQPAVGSFVANRDVALVKTRRANWFMLDSLEKTLQTPGLLGEEQLAWLAKSLDANPKTPALVLIHHNPGVDGNVGGLKDTAKLYEVLRPRAQVKAYIYGHTHDWKVTQDESGIHLINLPPVAYVFKEGMPSGWVQATMRRDGTKLELRCVNASHAQQGEVHDLKWRTKA